MSALRFVVTGAASGIGAATLASLKDAGHRCLAIDRNMLPREEFLACDLADESSIAACVEAINGPVDGVAHVAGIAGTAEAPSRAWRAWARSSSVGALTPLAASWARSAQPSRPMRPLAWAAPSSWVGVEPRWYRLAVSSAGT